MAAVPGTPFLDTSVVVRYLVGGEPEELVDRATEIIEGEGTLLVSELVLVEAAYVLASVYGVERSRVAEALAQLIQRCNLVSLYLPKARLLEALDLCRPSGRVSYTDAFLWSQAREAGAGGVFTFDRRFPGEGLALHA